MRLATFNCRHGAPDRPGLGAQFADGAGFAASVRALDADVLALQEIDRRVARSWWRDQPAQAALAGGASTVHFSAARRVLVTGHDGVALVVRGVTRSARTLRLPGRGAARVAALATVSVGGTELTVASTHLQSRSGGAPGEAEVQLDALLVELARWPRPWVLAGDLNLRPEAVLPRLDDAGLEPLRSGATFPSGAPRIEIDWLAVSGFAVVAPVPGGPPVRTVRLPVGDHRALVADVEVTP